MDTHIELGLAETVPGKQRVIVEVTPRLRKQMNDSGEDWSTKALDRKIKGKWVEITGWLLFDSMHVDGAENTTPGGDKNWRATCWEIHPVTAIKVTTPPAMAPAAAMTPLGTLRAKRLEELKGNATARENLRKRNEGLLLQFSDEDRED